MEKIFLQVFVLMLVVNIIIDLMQKNILIYWVMIGLWKSITTKKIITCDYYIIPFNKEFVRFNNSIKSYDTIKNLRAEKVYYHTELEGIVIRIREYWER